jgi:uncharacterized metal-binding protein YceD (DUF177 family)
MPILCNVRQLQKKALVFNGELSGEELDLEGVDECIKLRLPIKYHLDVQLMEGGILAQGQWKAVLDCECVHCLKPFQEVLEQSDWSCFLMLDGEEKVTVVNDCVDLTQPLREDILLAYPQQPLCEPGCDRLPEKAGARMTESSEARPSEMNSSVWAELNKLKL